MGTNHTAVCNERGKIMFLQEFNSTQLQRDADTVFKAAYKKPILVTRQAREGVVVLSKKEYARLVKAAS